MLAVIRRASPLPEPSLRRAEAFRRSLTVTVPALVTRLRAAATRLLRPPSRAFAETVSMPALATLTRSLRTPVRIALLRALRDRAAIRAVGFDAFPLPGRLEAIGG